MTIIAIYLLGQHTLGLSAPLWVLLLFAPDLSMLGYAAGNKLGAFFYNLFHHKGFAIVLAAAGYSLGFEVLLSAGLLLFAHASFDRLFGYGLKYSTGFKFTHLGSLQKSKPTAG